MTPQEEVNKLDPIPWYHSAVLRGILIATVSQLLLRVKTKFNVDLSLYGVDANGATELLLDAMTAAALAYSAHGRIAKPNPPIGNGNGKSLPERPPESGGS